MLRHIGLTLGCLAALGGCTGVQPVPGRFAVTGEAYRNIRSPISSIELPADSLLAGALIDGKPAFCNTKMILSHWDTGYPARGVCWFDPTGSGYLSSYIFFGDSYPILYRDPHVPDVLVDLDDVIRPWFALTGRGYPSSYQVVGNSSRVYHDSHIPYVLVDRDSAIRHAVAYAAGDTPEQRADAACTDKAHANDLMSAGDSVSQTFTALQAHSRCMLGYHETGTLPP